MEFEKMSKESLLEMKDQIDKELVNKKNAGKDWRDAVLEYAPQHVKVRLFKTMHVGNRRNEVIGFSYSEITEGQPEFWARLFGKLKPCLWTDSNKNVFLGRVGQSYEDAKKLLWD